MATDDQQVLVAGTAPAPASFTIPGNGQIRPKAVFATFDGSGAGAAFVPALKIVSDGGETVAICPASAGIAAGGSADVSWFQDVGSSGRFAVVVATSVAGLGVPFDGKIGAILVDSAYVVPLVYSATVGRWMGPYSQGPTVSLPGDTTTSVGTFVNLAGANTQRASIGTYSNYYNAGLRLSVDFAALLQNTGANTTSLRLGVGVFLDGDTVTQLNAFSPSISNTGVTNTWRVQEWADLTMNAPLVTGGYALLAAQAEVTAGTGQVASLVSRYRWYGVA